MKSMTGYGSCTIDRDGRQLTVEVKSVNHRFLDLNLRMPRSFAFLEDTIRSVIGSRISRGHIDVFITYRNLREDSKNVTLDTALANAYMKAFDELVELTGVRDTRTLDTFIRLPDVFAVTEAEDDRDALTVLMNDTLSGALDELTAMRVKEGINMQADMENRLATMAGAISAIEERYPDTVKEYRAKLQQRVEEMLAGTEVDEARLLQEVAVMADHSAIDEETVRFRSHLDQIRGLFSLTEPIGKRLDFIVQELNREANTISSKSMDIPITRKVVELKSEIEKLREQLQNIE